jgi:hypothetical protein
MRIPKRYQRIDAWRGYWIPGKAVAGASDTGMASDSPCRTDVAKSEIRTLQTFLRKKGIKTRTRYGSSSNVFCGKRWLCVVDANQHAEAIEIADMWLDQTRRSTRLIHDARGNV